MRSHCYMLQGRKKTVVSDLKRVTAANERTTWAHADTCHCNLLSPSRRRRRVTLLFSAAATTSGEDD